MKTALFIMFPVLSHYNICYGLADSLRKKGYRVVFAGTQTVQKHVESQEFEFVQLHYMQDTVVANWRTALGLFITNVMEKKAMRIRYKEFLVSVANVHNLCQHIAPDELYIDEHLHFYYLLLKSVYPNCTSINTKLPTQRTPGIPPLTCSLPFKDNTLYAIYAWWLWKKYMANYYYCSWRKTIVLLGIDENYFLKRVTKKWGVKIEQCINPANLLHDGLTGAQIIHLVPRNMEYEWYKMQPTEYFFYRPYYRKEENISSLFWNKTQSLLKQREDGRIKLVYASLGTLSEGNIRVATKFLENLIAAFETLPEIHLILADKHMFTTKSTDLPFNVQIYDWVPQTELLKYCDLMITHGGTNSILECVQAGVTILSYPLNLLADHPGNTARVVANGWGQQGNLRHDTQSQIRQEITTILRRPSLLKMDVSVKMSSIID